MSQQITVSTTVAAPVTQVWEAWTEPKHITKWNFASDDWQCPSATNDLKVGGKYQARMEAKDGSFGFDFVATYDDVKKNKRIAYTMEDGRKAITDFKEVNGKTEVTTMFDPESENSEEMQKSGWQAILDNFQKYVETTLH